jgi:hypothetical protein
MTRVLEHDLTCLDCQRTRTVWSGGWDGRSRTFSNWVRASTHGRVTPQCFVSPQRIELCLTEGKNFPLYQ